MVQLCTEAGDTRNLLLTNIFESVWSELGDNQRALERMSAHEQAAGQTEEVAAPAISRVHMGSVLATEADAESLERATLYAQSALACVGSFPITAIIAHHILARVLLRRGNLIAAEAEARQAIQILEVVPKYEPNVYATLIHALLAQDRVAAAMEQAQQGRSIIDRFGGIGHAEVELRLAVSEAFHAAGHRERARRELAETLHQIQLRADDITDPFWKASYLTRNAYCARAQLLAREWALDIVVR